MTATMDGSVKYCGHEVIKYKDGREFVNLSVVDEDQVPFTIFCPGEFQYPLTHAEFGQSLTLTFDVRRWNNNLTLRAKEVFL